MKKTLILSALVIGLNLTSNAQSILSKATSVASAAGFDVSSLTSGIIGKLTPALGLTAAQKPAVTSAVKDFLVQKATILALKKTDSNAYTSKLGGLTSNLKSKLGTALTVAQLTKFASLKPKTESASNVLSQLFY